MENDNKYIAKQLFETVNGKITLLRTELDMLEAEGNGLRAIASAIVGQLEKSAQFNDPAQVTDASTVVHHKWAEQAQRYNVQANTVAKLLLEKSKQMLDLIQFLKMKLRELGFEIPEERADPLDWDEFLFEKEDATTAEF